MSLTLDEDIELPRVSLAGAAAGLAIVRPRVLLCHVLQQQHPPVLLLLLALHFRPAAAPPVNLRLRAGHGGRNEVRSEDEEVDVRIGCERVCDWGREESCEVGR